MIQLTEVSKTYSTKKGPLGALKGLTLDIAQGEFVAVRGPSGCGKTTLLLMVGGMLRPSCGSVKVEGRDLYSLSVAERAAYRAGEVGFVFQMFHLVPYLSVLENVLLSQSGADGRRNVDRKAAAEILEKFGLAPRLTHKPAELSAGEKQRTALARALVGKPKILLADEPTGNLDPDNADQVFQHMSEFHRAGGTVIVVTHGTTADPYADRVVFLREGHLETIQTKEALTVS
jgi:ABC-type lipoprotein export system ATPase subunit